MSDAEARAQEARDEVALIRDDPALEMAHLFGDVTHLAIDATRNGTTWVTWTEDDGVVTITGTGVVSRETSTPPCPECEQGKCGNCDGTSWNPVADDLDACPCAKRGHHV